MSVVFHEEAHPYLVDIQSVSQHPENPNNGDVDALTESILANGFYGVVIAQKSTGRILAGNHRYAALLALGATEIPVQYVDVDDMKAKTMLVADNRLSELARRDPHALEKMLLEIEREAEAGLAGTGYDQESLLELQRVNRAVDHIGFGEKFSAATDESDLGRPMLVVYGLEFDDGQYEPFDHDEMEEHRVRLRELGYRVIERSDG